MSRTKTIVAIILILGTTITLAFAGGYNLGQRNEAATADGADLITQAWNIIFAHYVDRDNLNPTKLSRAAITGMVTELNDPHASYLTPDENKLGQSSLQGKIGGIGAQVALRDKKLVIIASVPGSPAAKAGIRAGDIILQINGKSTADMSLAEAVLTIRGEQGTSVRITIQHEGETAPVELEIVRAEINLASVRFEMKGDIAYIDISHFTSRTDDELTPVILNLSQENPTGIILDLRSNPGGILETVINVASHFIREGVVVNVRDYQGNVHARYVTPGLPVTDFPMIVLTDNYSASGSEVLAGALQDYSRAVIAGTRTYGKGSVDILRQLSDGSGLYITTGRWLTPNGRLIEGQGLSPDYELAPDADAIQWAIDFLKTGKN